MAEKREVAQFRVILPWHF